MAHKKGAGSSDNGRDSISKRLGVKMFGGQVAKAGNIIVRQRGTKFHPGQNVYMGKDHTLHAQIDGVIVFRKSTNDRRYVSVLPADAVMLAKPKVEKVVKVKAPVAPKATVVAAKPAAPAAKPAAPIASTVDGVDLELAAAGISAADFKTTSHTTTTTTVVVSADSVRADIGSDDISVSQTIAAAPAPEVSTEKTSVVISSPSFTTGAGIKSTTTTTITTSSSSTSSMSEATIGDDWDDATTTSTTESTSVHVTGASPKQDDLKIIEGVGPKIEQLLHDGGIKTWLELSTTPVERIQEILDAAGPRYQIHNPSTWPAQAKFAHEGKFEELKEYQDMLTGGRDLTE